MGREEVHGRDPGVDAMVSSSTAPTTAAADGGGRNSVTWAMGRSRRRKAMSEAWKSRQVAPAEAKQAADVSDCILLFGAFCNGNMGDVVQPISVENLLASVAPKEQCFYYAHPRGEDPSKGFRIGEFFGGDESKLIGISSDSASEVNRFKAFVIGGGGIFADMHSPLFVDRFVENLTLPVVVLGVGANYHAKEYSALLKKAVFVSGRDTTTVERFSDILNRSVNPAVWPGDVRLVRDPVLSDTTLTDNTGSCWKQSQAANTESAIRDHEQLKANVVKRDDRLINVFPKHQAEMKQFQYPGTVREILDPLEYAKRLCSCKAIISTRFHGVILGLHMGVPTFGALHMASGNKVPDLMVDTMSLPDQFFLIDGNLTREVVDRQVDAVRRLYDDGGRRVAIHERLAVFHEEFGAEARHVLDIVGVARPQPDQQTSAEHPHLAFEKDTWQPQGGVEGGSVDGARATASTASVGADSSTPVIRPPLSNRPLNPAMPGLDSIVAVFVLFAIAGLAVLPSTAGGKGRGSHQELSEGAANGDCERLLGDDRRTSAGYSRVQKEVNARNGTSTAEQGFSPERSATTAVAPSPPRRLQLGARSLSEPSNLLFALNFALWIALAVTFSSYSKSYLRDTRDPVGLLALQGVTGSVVLFLLGRLGLGASDTSNPSVSASKPGSLLGLRTPLTTASPRETLAAVLHSGQAVLTNFSLFVGGVAVTNALKAMEPVAAAVASYFLLGKRVAPGGVAALVIIVAGILLLTSKGAGGGGHPDAGDATDTGGGGREIIGRVLVSAAFTMAAVSCNALRNVVIKKGDPIPPHQTLFTCSVAAGMIGVASLILRLVFKHMDELLLGGEEDRAARGGNGASQYGSLLSMSGINAALCFVGYNLASFNLLARLSPVGHAVGNSVKRVVMFGSGIVLMGEVMTARQLTGAAVALAGVGVYNVAGKRK